MSTKRKLYDRDPPTSTALPMRYIAAYMKMHGLKLVTAESCTSGLIASAIAETPGAGELLDCAFVTHAPAAKERCLGVRPETLNRHGLTSEPVAREMALGALTRSEGNFAVANAGGPYASDPMIATGTLCFAWAFRVQGAEPVVVTETRIFIGERNAVRHESAHYALARIVPLHMRSIRRLKLGMRARQKIDAAA
ncbi:CinA family protein [Piscinibacter gummiphilus]|nr:nicotinamide-nucleotide amidohydrolase family protein [Piscinibacter gummiphilus]GLS95554.1 hypothetical protein GCM10007918_28460 [Piscinibacter gummiphilus]